MLRSIYNPVKASLWNVYNEMTPDLEDLGCAPYIIFAYIFETWKYILRYLRPTKQPKKVIATASKPREETILENIERRAGRYVHIETSPFGENFAKFHPQDQSPLFNKLPLEIRTMIWKFTVSQSDDPNHRYSGTAYYYRPGHVARHKTYTSFLLSCRRIWLEANALPMQLAEHSFWFSRGPFDQKGAHGWAALAANSRLETGRYTKFLDGLTLFNLQNLTHIHLFLQMSQAQEFNYSYKMDDFIPDTYLLPGLRPKLFHITIRQSDWWDWERNAALNLDGLMMNNERGAWVQAILDSPLLGGTRELRIELETIESKLPELNRIVERLRNLEGKPTSISPAKKSSELSKFVCAEPPRQWIWKRYTNLYDNDWDVFTDLKELKLHVAVLTWKKKPIATMKPNNSAPISMKTSNTIEQSPTVPGAVQTQQVTSRSPADIMELRAALLHDIEANCTDNLDAQATATQYWFDEGANEMENIRRARFARMMSNMVAKDIEQWWEREGSLLKFVDHQSEEAWHLQWMALFRKRNTIQ